MFNMIQIQSHKIVFENITFRAGVIHAAITITLFVLILNHTPIQSCVAALVPPLNTSTIQMT